MPSYFTGNTIEGQITFPTSTLGFLVNQLSMGMKIKVREIPENGNTDTHKIKYSIINK